LFSWININLYFLNKWDKAIQFYQPLQLKHFYSLKLPQQQLKQTSLMTF